SFADLMVRLNQGDQAAAAKVFHRFTNRLVGRARIHLDGRVRQKVDPEDVLQSVYRSFFLRQAQGQFELEGWDNLWSLLTVLTVRKCPRVNRCFLGGRRDVKSEAPGDEPAWEAIGRDPTPSHVYMLSELVKRLLTGLSERDRHIVSLALQGYTPAEIVKQTGT